MNYILGAIGACALLAYVAYKLGQRNMRARLERTLSRAGSRFSGDDL
jgi:hypothetical protein